MPVDMSDDQLLIKIASTSLNSKVVSQHSWLLAPMAVKAIKSIIDVDKDNNVDLRNIRIVKKLGCVLCTANTRKSILFCSETVEESQLIEGALFDQKASGTAGAPTRVEKAKIGLIQFQLSPPKTDVSFCCFRLVMQILFADGESGDHLRLHANGPCST